MRKLADKRRAHWRAMASMLAFVFLMAVIVPAYGNDVGEAVPSEGPAAEATAPEAEAAPAEEAAAEEAAVVAEEAAPEAPAANEVMPAALVEPVLEEGQVTDPDCDDWVKLEANFMTGQQYMVDGVTVDVYDDGMGQEFDFSSERRVCKVYVKGGPDTNVYTYDPGVFEDEGLHAPFNPGSEKWYDLSNIIFCFCPDEPVVEIDLSIVKEADVETVLPGGLINYTITVCNESTTTCGTSSWSMTSTRTR